MEKNNTISKLLSALIAATAIFTIFCVSAALAAGGVNIKAKKVKKIPESLDAKEWGKAKEVDVTLDGAGMFEQKQKQIKVKAVYVKKDKIAFLLTWEDPTRSMDGQAWVKEGDKWKQKEGSEDRVALNFEVRRIKNFATKGCAVVCHSEAKDPNEWKYHTEKAPQLGDLWVWESYRTQPLGHSGDYYVDDDSRKADKGTGKALKNINKFGDGPVYMPDPDKKSAIEGSLTEDNLKEIGDNAVEMTPAWILAKFSGDFADIKSKAEYKDGKWTVMMERKLKTGSDTDVKFNVKKKYSFGIAVFDNSGRQHSYNSPPLKLSF